jgi:hypothetical protein
VASDEEKELIRGFLKKAAHEILQINSDISGQAGHWAEGTRRNIQDGEVIRNQE